MSSSPAAILQTSHQTRFADFPFLAAVSLLYLVVSLSLFLSWPPLWPDEAVFADTARGLLHGGRPATELVAGLENGAFWQAPGWYYVAAGVISVAGFDIAPLRLLSVLLGLVVIWLSVLLARRAGSSRWVARGTAMLLALAPVFVLNVKLARMDGLCMVFVLAGLIGYVSWASGGRSRILWLSASAFMLAVLTHPLGVIGPVVGAIHALTVGGLRKRSTLHAVSWMFGAVGLALLVWVLVAGDPAELGRQLRYQLWRKASSPENHLVGFVARYWSIPLLGLLIPAGIFRLWHEARTRRTAGSTVLALAATVSTVVVMLSFELSYHVYYLPFVVPGIAGLFERLCSRGGRVKVVGVVVLVTLVANLVAYTAYFNYRLHIQLREETNYSSFCRAIARELPEGAAVVINGYPTVYWGLLKTGKGFAMVEGTFLTDSIGMAVFDWAGWVVLSDGFRKNQGSSELKAQLPVVSEFAAKAGKRLIEEAIVGVDEDYAYTARILRVTAAVSP